MLTGPKQHTIGGSERPACPTQLLVISHHGTRHLVMNYKTKVRLIKAHSQCCGSDKGFDLVIQQGVFQLHTAFTRFTSVVSVK